MTKIYGLIAGLLNGIFGSGGGIAVVKYLESENVPPQKSHATSVAAVFVLSAVSAAAFGLNGELDIKTALSYIPWGIAGCITGTLLLKKIKGSMLKKIFGAIIAVSGVALFL